MPHMRKIGTEAELRRCLRMYNTTKDIAIALECTPKAVTQALRRLGLPTPQELKIGRKKGESFPEIQG